MTGFTPCAEGCEVIFNTADNSLPLDRPRPVIEHLASSAANLLIALGVICIVGCILAGIMIYLNSHKKLVKSFQPFMLYITLTGGVIGSARVILGGLALTNAVCIATIWTGKRTNERTN